MYRILDLDGEKSPVYNQWLIAICHYILPVRKLPITVYLATALFMGSQPLDRDGSSIHKG